MSRSASFPLIALFASKAQESKGNAKRMTKLSLHAAQGLQAVAAPGDHGESASVGTRALDTTVRRLSRIVSLVVDVAQVQPLAI